MPIACKVCHRALRNPVSILRGIGPVCARKNLGGVIDSQTNLLLETMIPKAKFDVKISGDVLLVVDLYNPGSPSMTVTNDAEAVTEYVLAHFGSKRRILYRDTEGRWDELKHDGQKFTGFAPIAQSDKAKYGLE